MSDSTIQTITANSRVKTILLLCTGCAFGWLAADSDFSADANADERRKTPPVAFKSGGERSVEVLEKISKQITALDARLARIETAVAGKTK